MPVDTRRQKYLRGTLDRSASPAALAMPDAPPQMGMTPQGGPQPAQKRLGSSITFPGGRRVNYSGGRRRVMDPGSLGSIPARMPKAVTQGAIPPGAELPQPPPPVPELEQARAQLGGFEEWKKRMAPNDSGYDYDFRGAYEAGVSPGPNGHWPDTFKRPWHPTFSNESKYASGDNARYAGRWDGETFIPPTERFPDTLRPPEPGAPRPPAVNVSGTEFGPPAFGQGRPDGRAPLFERVQQEGGARGFDPTAPSAYYGAMQVGPKGGGDVDPRSPVSGFYGNYTPQQEADYQAQPYLAAGLEPPRAPGGGDDLKNLISYGSDLRRNFADESLQERVDRLTFERLGIPYPTEAQVGGATEEPQPERPGPLDGFFNWLGGLAGGDETQQSGPAQSPAASADQASPLPPEAQNATPEIQGEIQRLMNSGVPVLYDDETGEWAYRGPNGEIISLSPRPEPGQPSRETLEAGRARVPDDPEPPQRERVNPANAYLESRKVGGDGGGASLREALLDPLGEHFSPVAQALKAQNSGRRRLSGHRGRYLSRNQ